MKKILFVCPYPLACAPSQRFRFEQYLDILIKNNFSYTFSPFLDDKTWHILYKNGFKFQKIIGILGGFWRRFLLLFSVVRYDYIFIHREASPIGLPFFEWITAKILRKKIIFDFDDAIWLPNTSENNKIVAKLKFHSKTHLICQWAHKISVGNPYLLEYATQFNTNKNKPKNILNPTTIDTENLHLFSEKKISSKKIIIGWTGTHSTIKYLDDILPIILELEQKYDFEFRVISNQKPHFKINNIDLTPKSFVFKEWNKTTEIEDLSAFDIGLMPLIDDIWAKGKCGFKALQYMAVGAVALVSPVGVNTHIIAHKENGFICDSLQSWKNALIFILENPEKVENIRQNARKTIVERYCILSNQANFLGLFAD